MSQSFVHTVELTLNMSWKFKKGDRVLVDWLDIVADLHTEDNIKPCKAQSVGWIESITTKYIRLTTSRYLDSCELADKIVIPIGCVEDINAI